MEDIMQQLDNAKDIEEVKKILRVRRDDTVQTMLAKMATVAVLMNTNQSAFKAGRFQVTIDLGAEETQSLQETVEEDEDGPKQMVLFTH